MFANAGARAAARLFFLSLLALPASAQRFFKASEGFVLAKDLPEDYRATVRSVQLDIKDAFDGSTAYSEAEEFAFSIGNKLHIESRAGTIRRRLLFREGDSLSKGLLLETEKNLRAEQFLADAYIEVKTWEDGSAHLLVTTYDQWTTTLAFTPAFLGGEFFYQAGVVESNLLGTGQRMGFFLMDQRERDMALVDYANNALSPYRLRLASQAAWLSDGYSVQASLGKPLETRTDFYAFSISWTAEELSEFVYFDANQLDQLPDSIANRKALNEGALAIFKFDQVATHLVSASVTRSFGTRTKFNVSPTLDWKERYNHGDIIPSPGLNTRFPPPPSAGQPEERHDFLGGVSLSLYQYNYKTVHNYRNLKWGETLETGWRLSTKFAQNQEWLGAGNHDFYLSHAAVYNNAWWDAIFFNANASLKYFVSPGGDFDNGQSSAFAEIQWKPHRVTSTYLSATYGNLFASEQSQQLLLGEDTGLNGFPNAYYAGQAFLLLNAEQRFFTGVEFGTLVPALAVFGNAGNTYPAWEDFDAGDLHYSVGTGLRIGFSKTVQKLVWHVNLSHPVDDDRLDGLVFSFRVKLGL